MKVELKHSPNPDIPGYWTPPEDSGKSKWIEVASFEEASKVCQDFIERNELGGGNWSGGAIKDNNKLIGYVSYNGRVWPIKKLDKQIHLRV